MIMIWLLAAKTRSQRAKTMRPGEALGGLKSSRCSRAPCDGAGDDGGFSCDTVHRFSGVSPGPSEKALGGFEPPKLSTTVSECNTPTRRGPASIFTGVYLM